VDEVELRCRQGIDDDVVAGDVDVAELGQRFEEAGFDVGGEDPAGRTDAFRQVTYDRATTGADLETPPAVTDAECVEMAAGDGIVEVGQRRESVARFLFAVVEEVGRLGHGTAS
jgi:hypothetical protein